MTNRFKVPTIGVLATLFLLLGVLPAQGQMLAQNLGDLIEHSKYILVATVTSVTDGIDDGVPYTEVTLEVSEALHGNANRQHTFRQFGLIKPREMSNGYVNANVTPDGWARYAEGEEVMLFLYKEASLTGLSTTVGLFQGKFTIVDGQIANAINNQGLFRNISVPTSQLTEEEGKFLLKTKGSLPASTFIAFVRKAVEGRWFF